MALRVLMHLALLAAFVVPAQAQEWSFEGRELLATNLVGAVTVRGHDGDRIVVRATPSGRDAERLNFKVRREGAAEFHVVYPLDESRRYVYPPMGHGRSEIHVRGWRRASSFLGDLLSRVEEVEIQGRGGDGLEAWADLEILVPEGVSTRVKLGVGKLTATGVAANVDLDSHGGDVEAREIRGATRIDTGSGSVRVAAIRGDLEIDTGSGEVDAEDVQGGSIGIDTGSGSVDLRRATAQRLIIDTGSGSVRTDELEVESSVIDTGSGSVTLSLVRLDDGAHEIDTGSGRVTVYLPTDASVRVLAETGSGGIRLDIPDARLHRMSRDELDIEIGGGGARLMIDTGSGGITLRNR